MSPRVSQKVARLKGIVAERAAWAEPLAQIKRMQQWVLDVEHILDSSWAQAEESVSNATVGQRLDAWRQKLLVHLKNGTLSELEQECLTQFLQVLSNLRPHLVQCYDRESFPRTNNEMERCIRGLKTRYRRISGRKNWNSYLLRYGRCVAYARLVGARCDQAGTVGAARRPARLCPLAPVALRSQNGSERATQALSLPPQAPGLSRFT